MALHFGKFLIAYQVIISAGILVVQIMLIKHSASRQKDPMHEENWQKQFTFCLKREKKPSFLLETNPKSNFQPYSRPLACPALFPICELRERKKEPKENTIFCSYRLPTALGQGIFVALIHGGMNLYYLRSEILRPTVKFVSIVFLLLCTCWDFFCTHIYLGILKDARNYDSWFLDDMDMKDELVQEIKLKCVPFVVLHVLEAILCGYTFIVMLLTGSAYEYAESLNMSWDEVKKMTPWTITKRNLMQDRIARIVRGQITDKNGRPITASPPMAKKRWAMIQNDIEENDSSPSVRELHRIASKEDLHRKKQFTRQNSWKNLSLA